MGCDDKQIDGYETKVLTCKSVNNFSVWIHAVNFCLAQLQTLNSHKKQQNNCVSSLNAP